MGFAQIIFLSGLAAVAGPILIHLLIRPRFKRVLFTMIDFLEVSQKQSQSTRRLREWLILLLRCAIVSLLACMFARPFMTRPGEGVERPDRHFMVVDNSLSMTYTTEGLSQLDRAIEKAAQYVKDHAAANVLFDVYALCGDTGQSRLAPQEAVDALERISASAHKAEMGDVCSAARDAIQTGEHTSLYLVSDFTRAAMDALAACQSLTGFQDVITDTVAAPEPDNAMVKHARVLRYQNGTVELLVQVENTGSVAQTRRLGASVKGLDVGVTPEQTLIALEPARSGDYVLKLTPDSATRGRTFLPVEISLSPPDALAVDDTYFLGVHIEPSAQQRVLVAGRTPDQGFLVREALKAISRAEFDDNLILRSNPGPTLDHARLDKCDILVCAHIGDDLAQDIDALTSFLARGGTVVFFVSRDMSLPTAKRLYDRGLMGAEPFERLDERTSLSQVWPSDGMFASAGLDVDTARVTKQYTLEHLPLWSHFACRKAPESTGLWPTETGYCLIYTLAVGAGKSLLINTSMDDTMSSLTKRPVVIPMCRLILGSGSAAYGYGYQAEEQVVLPVFESEQVRIDPDIWVADPSGRRHPVIVTGSSLTVYTPDQTGWLATLSDPVRYAGINPVQGETDLHPTESVDIDQCLAGLSSPRGDPLPGNLAAPGADLNRPLWRLLAGIIIGLVWVEGWIVNRIKR
ncbi:MAG: BatA domain-containing protein [Phycisphaerae bacterium]|nr:BatA domain-containing protein [Phycisphaerae bacterium]